MFKWTLTPFFRIFSTGSTARQRSVQRQDMCRDGDQARADGAGRPAGKPDLPGDVDAQNEFGF